MEMFIGLIVVAGIVYFFVITRRTRSWGADSRQQQIARMLIESAETNDMHKEVKIVHFMIAQGWSKSEMKSRIAHAVSITKISAIPSVYSLTKEAGSRINETIHKAL